MAEDEAEYWLIKFRMLSTFLSLIEVSTKRESEWMMNLFELLV